MKKLRLDVEDLRISSFAVELAGDEERGTVRAHAATEGCTGGQTYDDPLCALTWRCTEVPTVC